MIRVLGMGNALVDIMTRLNNDALLTALSFPKGSMQLVNKEDSDRILKATEHLEHIKASGGSAANTVHGLAHLGIETGFIGKTGQDELGAFFELDLINNGIEPKLFHSSTLSGRAIALVSPDSERTFATYLGAAVELSAEDIYPELFNNYHFFHIEGYLVQNHELLEKSLQLAKEKQLITSLDMASFNVVEANLDFLHKIIDEYVDILFANEEEAKAFTGEEPEEALPIIAKMCDISVVKTGKNGSLIQRGNQVEKIGIIDATPIDTTGAGDLYASGFLYGLIHGFPLKTCGEIGAVLSGKVIEEIGAKIHPSKWNSIREMIPATQ